MFSYHFPKLQDLFFQLGCFLCLFLEAFIQKAVEEVHLFSAVKVQLFSFLQLPLVKFLTFKIPEKMKHHHQQMRYNFCQTNHLIGLEPA